jgi:Tfp pilus assembly protein FimV
LANGNTAVGASALFENVDGSENTAVGDSTGRNLITGSNNTYIGDLVGSLAADESDTIRIGDVSNGNGAGSLECYIGGIFNNFQPVSETVVQVTLDLANDHLGWDFGPGRGGSSPVKRSAPQRRSDAPTRRPTTINGKVGKVEKLEATVAQQQKQLETLTAELRKQAAQIEKVSAQLEANKPAPKVVNNL